MAPIQGSLSNSRHCTRVLKVSVSKIGTFVFQEPHFSFLGEWKIQLAEGSADAANLREAAAHLRDGDVPVAFPTETVYGLGADATRSCAVCGIYGAKQRPSDNPLIVHISSLSQLRHLLSRNNDSGIGSTTTGLAPDPIPEIYHPLIAKFWPGPLTILLPLPTPSPLAAEVTSSLPTVAVRMPSSRLALALIQLADRPLAAPSANASSKPSPTTAAHVLHDLAGRIDLIVDGGPCEVGVESTVVDGLTDPPVVLRPGGVSIDMLREISGWKDVRIAYQDGPQKEPPRAPGMKYKHYSPNARVLLFHGRINIEITRRYAQRAKSVGFLATKSWKPEMLHAKPQHGERSSPLSGQVDGSHEKQWIHERQETTNSLLAGGDAMEEVLMKPIPNAQHSTIDLAGNGEYATDVWAIALGEDAAAIARGLFSALRELDHKNVDVILVEGIDDSKGGSRAAIMNRLRKAAEMEISL